MLQYLIKFSISLAVLYVFYRAVLRPLTFYQWNRFYLLGYSLLSFVIPFIDIAAWVGEGAGEDNRYISIIPSVSRFTVMAGKNQPSFFQQLTVANWWLLVFLAGMIFMLVRLLLQYISLYHLRGKSRLLTGHDNVQLYETSETIAPFSFGNAIYINPALHTGEELQRIIQHEFVHVRQKHSIDLLTGELLCIINWFNPFAWMIRYAIRQNLEFIADQQVLQNGIDKKDYQYLLLKVIGAPQYAIASHFNFSNLKKRIAMMNKMKTARLHLTKFLFVLPLLAVLVLAFRGKNNEENSHYYAIIFYDRQTNEPIKGVTVTHEQTNNVFVTDENGYVALPVVADKISLLHVSTTFKKSGYYYFERRFQMEVNTIRQKSVIELIGLQKGDQNNNCTNCLASMSYSDEPAGQLYNSSLIFYQLYFSKKNKQVKGFNAEIIDTVPAPPPPPPTAVNKKGYTLTIADNNGECVVLVKDQQRTIVKAMTLEEWNKNKKENEARYGAIPPPPPPVPVAPKLPAGVTQINIHSEKNSKTGANTNKATVVLKNGAVEQYNLDNAEEKAAYVKKYGQLQQPAMPVTPVAPVAPVNNAPITQPVPPVPPSTDASLSLHKQPVAPVSGMVTLKGVNAGYPPLYIVDGKEMEEGYDINKLRPEDISSISVWKDEKAISKYGEKAKYGAVDITTKKAKETVLPDGVLIVLDGKELPAGSKIDDYVKPDAIENMYVLKDKMATIKYGEKGKKGVIEIKTKSAVKPAVKNEIINIIADSIVMDKQHVQITGGSVTFKENEGIAVVEGTFHIGAVTDLPYVVFNGKEVKDIPAFTIAKAKFSVRSLDPEQGIAKYGSKAVFGALEINSL